MKKGKLNTVTFVIILIAAFMVLINGGIGTFFTIKSVNDMKNLVQGKMLDLASSAAYMLDGDDLIKLTEEDCVNKTKRYQDAYDTLDGFKTSNTRNNAEFAYIYLLKQVDEKTFIFTIDVDPEEPAAYGTPTIYTAALASAGRGIPAFDDTSYIDAWGEYYTAYCPVFTIDGKVAAIVACDCSASWYKNEIVTNVWSIVLITVVSTVFGIALALILNQRLRRKFNILVKETNDLQNDVDSLINEIKMPKEFALDNEQPKLEGKDDELAELRSRVQLMQKEIRSYLEYTKELAYIDPLTNMGNRTAYIERLNAFNENINEESILSVIIFDINGLKRINDNYGHDIGDKSIIEVGNKVKNVFGSKVSYRIGGDEMVVIIEDNNVDYINELLNRFEANMQVFNDRNELPFKLSVSYGFASYDYEIDKTFNDVFNRADGLMYQNKNKFYDLNDAK